MMDREKICKSYFAGRKEGALAFREELSREGFSCPEHLLEHVFWSNAALDENEGLDTFYAPLPGKGRFNATSFLPAEGSSLPRVEKTGDFLRLAVTSHFVLDLSETKDEESFFKRLSQKNRKKLRWLRNAVPAKGCRVEKLEKDSQFDLFEKLYCAQFPKYVSGGEEMRSLRKMYEAFCREGKSFSFLLLSPENEPLAASLGYISGDAFNYTHLTRARGEFDKFSPGYFLTYEVIVRLLAEHPEVKYFFMGPGEYDYKRALLGEPFLVFRYERNTLTNLFGILRLYFRCRKERKKALLSR
ncbi:MAG: GNAT family N-acetyltransferase [Lentisphaeria bacterium]|nr:GNAT family N-acetyltransferase [Lentisphaeria bacterium]